MHSVGENLKCMNSAWVESQTLRLKKKKKRGRKLAEAKHRHKSKQILNVVEKIVADMNPNRY